MWSDMDKEEVTRRLDKEQEKLEKAHPLARKIGNAVIGIVKKEIESTDFNDQYHSTPECASVCGSYVATGKNNLFKHKLNNSPFFKKGLSKSASCGVVIRSRGKDDDEENYLS